MNAPFDPTFMTNEKFAVGQPGSRKQDPVLLRGEGRYAMALDAPQLHADAPGNVRLHFHYGDHEQVVAAFTRAAHATKLSLRNNRIVVCPMEPRSAISEYDASRPISGHRYIYTHITARTQSSGQGSPMGSKPCWRRIAWPCSERTNKANRAANGSSDSTIRP